MSQTNYDAMSYQELKRYFLDNREDKAALQAYLAKRQELPQRIITTVDDPDFDAKIQAEIHRQMIEMPHSRSYQEELMRYLQDVDRAIAYLNSVSDNPDRFQIALQNVLQAGSFDEDWWEELLLQHPRFETEIAEARQNLKAGKGISIEELRARNSIEPEA